MKTACFWRACTVYTRMCKSRQIPPQHRLVQLVYAAHSTPAQTGTIGTHCAFHAHSSRHGPALSTHTYSEANSQVTRAAAPNCLAVAAVYLCMNGLLYLFFLSGSSSFLPHLAQACFVHASLFSLLVFLIYRFLCFWLSFLFALRNNNKLCINRLLCVLRASRQHSSPSLLSPTQTSSVRHTSSLYTCPHAGTYPTNPTSAIILSSSLSVAISPFIPHHGGDVNTVPPLPPFATMTVCPSVSKSASTFVLSPCGVTTTPRGTPITKSSPFRPLRFSSLDDHINK